MNNPNAQPVLKVELRTRRSYLRVHALVRVDAYEMPAEDDDQERRRRLLLLGKGAVLAHRLARPLAAESDEKGN